MFNSNLILKSFIQHSIESRIFHVEELSIYNFHLSIFKFFRKLE